MMNEVNIMKDMQEVSNTNEMNIKKEMIAIKEFTYQDIEAVLKIYGEGIKTDISTFQTEVPDADAWDKGHLKIGRLKAVDENENMLGWVAISPTSSRCCYRGVAEVSIYIAEQARNKGVGEKLMRAEIEESEKNGIWTLQSGIIELNHASLALHEKCGFRRIGYRERIAKDSKGIWRSVVLMERRSSKPQFQ